MTIFFNLLVAFILGTIIGSFLNVVVYRYNTGKSFVTGRSKCYSCSKYLEWYELLPLFSYLMLGGKCLGCNSKISEQYFIVELITGIVFSGLFLRFGLTPMAFLYALVASVLIVMAVYDFKHKIIPDGMVFVFIALSIVVFLLNHPLATVFNPISMDLLAGPILFAFFAFFWLISKGAWMGFGDAKLAIGVGFLLGFSGGVYAIMLAFWIGAIVSLFVLLMQKIKFFGSKLSLKSEIPFAPFIILAVFIQLLSAWDFQNIINFFS